MKIYNNKDIMATINEIEDNGNGSYEIRLLVDKSMVNGTPTGFMQLIKELDIFINKIETLSPY